MNHYDLIVVGAGISGLSLAHTANRGGFRTLVLERNERAGGCFQSSRLGGDPGFWLELGAHTCYNSYGNLLAIMEECGIIGSIISRRKVGYRVLVDNEVKSIPSQLNFVELLGSVPRLFRTKKAGLSVETYYSQIVGKGNYAKVFGPAFNAVVCQRAADFPSDMLFKKRPRRKDVVKSFTLTGGIETIIEGIVSQPGMTLMKGKEAQALAVSGDLFRVTTRDGAAYESRSLAIALPPPAAAKLLETPFPRLAQTLAKVRLESVETVGVVLRKELLSLTPLAGLIAVDDAFYSAVSRDTVDHERYRGFAFHFKSGRLDDEGKLKRICEVLRVGRDQLEQVVAKQNVVPSPRVGHEGVVKEIDRLLAGKRLLLSGNYFAGLAIEDCVSRSLSEISRLRSLTA